MLEGGLTVLGISENRNNEKVNEITIRILNESKNQGNFSGFQFHFHPHLDCFHSFDVFWTNPRHFDFQLFLQVPL